MKADKDSLKRGTVLITGASSGLGLEFARIFAHENYDLILTSRSQKSLDDIVKEFKKTYSVHISTFAVDLARTNSARALYEWTVKKKLHVDYLINNAGIGHYGKFIDHTPEQEYDLLQLNVVSLTELCHLFIPQMIGRGKGRILNIASMAAFQAGAYYATYFASKAYVLLFTEALALEHEKDNIVISALCTGPARTKFFQQAKMTENSKLLQASFLTPQYVARVGYEGLMKGKLIITPGVKNKIISKTYRILPRAVIARITKKLIEIAARG